MIFVIFLYLLLLLLFFLISFFEVAQNSSKMAKNQAKNAMAGVDAHGSGKTSNMTAADEADAKRKLAQVCKSKKD